MGFLPLASPPITPYPGTSNLLSILWLNKEMVLPWFSDHYIQLMACPNHPAWINFFDDSEIDNIIYCYFICPFIQWQRFDRNLAIETTSLCEFIIKWIDKGYYIDIALDRFYIPFSECYNNKHFLHQTLVNGYDNVKKEVCISDFFNGEKYNRYFVSFNCIEKSFHNQKCSNSNIQNWQHNIYMYRFVEKKYEINVNLLKQSLIDFTNSIDSFGRYRYTYDFLYQDILYGLAIYDEIYKSFRNNDSIDMRAVHVIYDHCVAMNIRLHYLSKVGILGNTQFEMLIKENEQSVKLSNIIQSLSLKYNIGKKIDISKLANYIMSIKNSNIIISNTLIEVL